MDYLEGGANEGIPPQENIQFDDNFTIIDEMGNDLEYTRQDLNIFYEFGILNRRMLEEDTIDHIELNENSNLRAIHLEEKEEVQHEQVVIERLSQLTTQDGSLANECNKRPYPITSNDIFLATKRHKSIDQSQTFLQRDADGTNINDNDEDEDVQGTYDDDDDDDDDHDHDDSGVIVMPTYLTRSTGLFDAMIRRLIPVDCSVTVDDFRRMAMYQHSIQACQIDIDVYETYLKSGIGTLREPEPELVPIDRRVWPSAVKLAVSRYPVLQDNPRTEHEIYEEYVRKRILSISKTIDKYDKKLEQFKRNRPQLPIPMESAIRNYISQLGIRPLRMKANLRIAILNYDYEAQILERKFLNENPTDYQKQIAERLYKGKYDLEQARRELIELKERIVHNKPTPTWENFRHSLGASEPAVIENDNENDDEITKRLRHRENQKILRSKLFHFLVLEITRVEHRFGHCHRLFNNELSTMWQNHRHLVKDKGMSTVLTDIIEQRFINIVNKFRDIYAYRFQTYIFDNEYPYYNSTAMNAENPLSACLIIDCQHRLQQKQIQLLNRGPTYIPPCQSFILASSKSEGDIVRRKYASFKHKLASLLSKHEISIAQAMDIEEKAYEQFKRFFTDLRISTSMRQRAYFEMNLARMIQTNLKTDHLILRRTADDTNTFYLGEQSTFESLANAYLQREDMYELVFTLNDETIENAIEQQLKTVTESMNVALTLLKNRKLLRPNIIDELYIDQVTRIQMPYLYFLPSVSQENEIGLKAMIDASNCVTTKVAKYLDRLLRPFAERMMSSMTFKNEIDFMHQLMQFKEQQEGFNKTTLFCRLQLEHLSSIDTHQAMIDVICSFLHENLASNKLENVSISTIKNLLQLFFYNHFFVYDNKIYRLLKGSPNSMTLTELLTHIYLFQWQKIILKRIKTDHQFCGRYNNEIFFTWNKSHVELETILQIIRIDQHNVQFRKLIGTSVPFSFVYVSNQNGQLLTRIYHDPCKPMHTLPYLSGHPKRNYGDWLRQSLIEAACICTLVDDFHRQRIHLELTCLINGYSVMFVECHVSNLFDYFNAQSMRYCTDQQIYDKFRRRCFDFIQAQNERRTLIEQFQQQDRLFQLHYEYDYGPATEFNQQFHRYWLSLFKEHSVFSKDNCKVLLNARHVHSLNALLAFQKPTVLLKLQRKLT